MFIRDFFFHSKSSYKSELEVEYEAFLKQSALFKEEWKAIQCHAPGQWPLDHLGKLCEAGNTMQSIGPKIRMLHNKPEKQKCGLSIEKILIVSMVESDLNDSLPTLKTYLDANDQQRAALLESARKALEVCDRIIKISET